MEREGSYGFRRGAATGLLAPNLALNSSMFFCIFSSASCARSELELSERSRPPRVAISCEIRSMCSISLIKLRFCTVSPRVFSLAASNSLKKFWTSGTLAKRVS